jgi:beta-lactamase superfamily II metal-dependent hydrolase
MRQSIACLFALFLAVALPIAQPRTSKTLDLYVIDVEGGGATLFVTPSRESVLIDTGNPGVAATRDAGRIMEAVKDAGLTQIDHLIVTHWHGDHYGGLAELAGRIPIRHFYDHGPNVQPAQPVDEFLQQTYPGLYAKATHTIARPGDRIAINGLDWRIVTSAGEAIKTPLPGAGQPNPYCANSTPNPDDGGVENSMSVGSVIVFGKFRMVHLGDLTQKIETKLMCPTNQIGVADLWVVSHHGQPYSNGQMLVHAMQPRVALLNNGTRKGGQPDAMKVIFSSPRLEDLWQLHFSLLSGQEYSAPGMFIANLVDEQPPAMPVAPMSAPAPGSGAVAPPVHNGKAYWLKVSAQTDGSFTVTNTRNGFSKTYQAR